MGSIGDDEVIVFIGRRRVGKSKLLKNLLYYKRDIPIGCIINPTEASNKCYGDLVPSMFIHTEYKEDIIENLVKRQKLVMKAQKKEETTYGKSSIDPRAFLLLDDCMYDTSKLAKDKNFRYICFNGRHEKLLLLMTFQDALGLKPHLRSQFDVIFICREPARNQRKKLWDNFAGIIPDFDVFCQIMDTCTKNYECLVIDKRSMSNNIEDQVFWYKAEDTDKFQIGGRELWQLHHDNVRKAEQLEDEQEEEEEMFDLQTFKANKKQNLHIKKQQ